MADQVDYRQHPNAGGVDRANQHAGDYSNPIDQGSVIAAPWTDESWKSYDAQEDASRFNGINSPDAQADLLATPPYARDGWSHDKDLTS